MPPRPSSNSLLSNANYYGTPPSRPSRIPDSFELTDAELTHFAPICVAVGFDTSRYLRRNILVDFLATHTAPELNREDLQELLEMVWLEKSRSLDAKEFCLLLRIAGNSQACSRGRWVEVGTWKSVCGGLVSVVGVEGLESEGGDDEDGEEQEKDDREDSDSDDSDDSDDFNVSDSSSDDEAFLSRYYASYYGSAAAAYRARQADEDYSSISSDPFAGISFTTRRDSSSRTTAMGADIFVHRMNMQAYHNVLGGRRWDPVLGEEVEDEGLI